MKKHIPVLILCSTFLFSSIGVFSFKEKALRVNAGIDINDYSNCQSAYLSDNSSAMLEALRTITSPGKAGSYKALWDTYKTVYVRDDGYMFDYYSNATNYVPGGKAQGASYDEEGDSYNREHSIPKSWWGGSESNQGADPFIVVPTDGYVNNIRNNYSFGMVKEATYTSSGGFSKLGSADTSWGVNTTVFEPDDSLKGDFARIYFYAIAKYSGSYNWKTKEGALNFSGSASNGFGLTDYAIKLYSYWSSIDPVSDWERTINSKIATIQGNRNPFIDHPEYADTLWGSNSGYTFYNVIDHIEVSAPKTQYYVGDSFVKPNVLACFENGNNINVKNAATFSGFDSSNVCESQTITVSYKGFETSYVISVVERPEEPLSLTVSTTSIGLNVQETASITATANKNCNISWSIGDSSIVSLSVFTGEDVVATGLKAGDTTITVTATFSETGETDSKTITVVVNETTPPATPLTNKGCGGNVATASIVLTSLAFVGIVGIVIITIVRKKRINSK